MVQWGTYKSVAVAASQSGNSNNTLPITYNNFYALYLTTQATSLDYYRIGTINYVSKTLTKFTANCLHQNSNGAGNYEVDIIWLTIGY